LLISGNKSVYKNRIKRAFFNEELKVIKENASARRNKKTGKAKKK